MCCTCSYLCVCTFVYCWCMYVCMYACVCMLVRFAVVYWSVSFFFLSFSFSPLFYYFVLIYLFYFMFIFILLCFVFFSFPSFSFFFLSLSLSLFLFWFYFFFWFKFIYPLFICLFHFIHYTSPLPNYSSLFFFVLFCLLLSFLLSPSTHSVGWRHTNRSCNSVPYCQRESQTDRLTSLNDVIAMLSGCDRIAAWNIRS